MKHVPKNDGFKDFILDQLPDLHHVTCRAMFGGYGLYRQTMLFGSVYKDRLYFIVNATTGSQLPGIWHETVSPNAKQTLTSFYEVPIDVIENTESLTQWATEAVEK